MSRFAKRAAVGLALALTATALSLFTGCAKEEVKVNKEKNSVEQLELGLKAPAETVDIVQRDMSDSEEGILSARILQGVVNRAQPRVYLYDPIDTKGVDVEAVRYSVLEEYGDVALNEIASDTSSAHAHYRTFWTIFLKYREEIENIYIYDTDYAVADSVNVAAMLAGRNKGIAVNYELYERIVSEGYGEGLGVVDVCETYGFYNGSEDNSIAINGWIADNLVEGSNRDFVFVLSPRPREEGSTVFPQAYDLAVATNALIYHFDADFDLQKDMQKRILDQFDDNTRVIGWAGINQEEAYIRSISECNKEAVCIDWGFPNGSLLASFPRFTHKETLRPAKETREVKKDKVYVSFMVSDGDAWHYFTKEFLAYWNSNVRGKVPIGWQVPSLFSSFNPLLLEYVYDTKTDRDELMQGVTGVSYVQPHHLSDSAWTQFCYDTKNSLSSMGLTSLNYWDVGTDCYSKESARLKEFCAVVNPNAVLLGHCEYLPDYYMIGDTVLYSSLGKGVRGTHTAQEVVEAIDRSVEQTEEGKPVFASVNIEAWGDGVGTVQEAVDLLLSRPDSYKYEFILPSDMADAIRSYLKNGDNGTMSAAEKKPYESLTVTPGTAEEASYLIDGGSKINEDTGVRFADGDAYWVYRLSLQATECTVGMSIENEFIVSVSADGNQWREVARYGGSKETVYVSFDPSDYLENFNGTFYVKFEDAVKSDGFGAAIGSMTVRYR